MTFLSLIVEAVIAFGANMCTETKKKNSQLNVMITDIKETFLNSCALKLFDMVEFKAAQIIYKARNYQVLFRNLLDREWGYNLREKLNFQMLAVSSLNQQCGTV